MILALDEESNPILALDRRSVAAALTLHTVGVSGILEKTLMQLCSQLEATLMPRAEQQYAMQEGPHTLAVVGLFRLIFVMTVILIFAVTHKI